MTTQELTLHCENGTVRSDQTYRGLKKTLVTSGCRTENPYFFGALTKPGGNPGFEGKYGFESVRTFVKAAQGGSDHGLPTLAESAATTAILEAADLSLSRKSAVVPIEGQGDRFVVS